MERLYDDPQQEASSIMGWLDRRLEWASKSTLPLHVACFKKMWMESFGTWDTIPQEFKEKVSSRYKELKQKESNFG